MVMKVTNDGENDGYNDAGCDNHTNANDADDNDDWS